MGSQKAEGTGDKVRILFVCLGNICRSPAAEGILRQRLIDSALDLEVLVDSAGTGGWHVGELPDDRMRQAAKRRGYTLCHRARQVQPHDFETFDAIYGMDQSNVKNLHRLAQGVNRNLLKIESFGLLLGDRSFEIPDPYHGGPEGFERVLDLLEEGVNALVARLQHNSFHHNHE